MAATKEHAATYVEVTAPWCDREGTAYTYCQASDQLVKTEPIDALGCNMKSVDVVDATCTEAGYIHLRCIRCRKENTATTEAALGHAYNMNTAIAPTCTAEGMESRTCGRCGYVEETYEAALCHALGAAEHVCSTCTEQGHYLEKCTRCDYEEFILYTLAPHEWSYSVFSSSNDKFVNYVRDCMVCGAHNVTRIRQAD